MSAVNSKAMRYIDCPTCGSLRGGPCVTLGNNPGPYSGTWFVHYARKEPFMGEFYRGVAYGRKLAMNDRMETLL